MARRKQRHRETQAGRSPVKSFFKIFYFEITVTLLIAAGVFLLLERLRIKATIWRGLMGFLSALRRFAGYIVQKGLVLWDSIEMSDIVGIVLIGTAMLMLLFRARKRAIGRHPDYLSMECPKCHADLERVYTRWLHRPVAALLLIHIRRYACTKCSFHGTAWLGKREHGWRKKKA